MIRRILCLTIYFVFVVTGHSLGRDTKLTRYEFTQPHMGTVFRIILYAPDSKTATRASNAAFARIAQLDSIMSDYQPTSELSLLSDCAGGRPIKTSHDLFRVLAKAQEIARQSNGAFDITAGPIIHLWRRARRERELPDRTSLTRALQLVGYKKLRLDAQGQTAELVDRGMLLDLGGIAKGDASDQALIVLKHYGIRSALVAAGGDIAVSAPPPGEAGWKIGIAPLSSPNGPPVRYVTLHDSGISTSGDAEQHMVIGGIRYSHIIDPRTGWALTGQISATVIAPHDITADPLATTVTVLGPQRGMALIKSMPDTAVFIMHMAKGGIQSYAWRFPLNPASTRATTPATSFTCPRARRHQEIKSATRPPKPPPEQQLRQF